jgi:beta-lactamase class A
MSTPFRFSMNCGVCAAVALAGFLFGRMTSQSSLPLNLSGSLIERHDPDSRFQLLNPLLDCEGTDATAHLSESRDFTPDIQTYIDTAKRKGQLISGAVYFRDLNNGPWRSVNGEAVFSPASLLKLPIMIAYLKWSESEPGVIDRKLVYDGEAASNDVAQPDTPKEFILEKGKSYRVSDLLERMIVYSDNNAKNLLQQHMPDELISKIMRDTGMPARILQNPENSLTVREYATFFRILYNASYLTREHSQQALEQLTRSVFTRGLAAGLPSGIPVAHKYGVRNIDTDDETRQLHDCGIIYNSKNPYLLCVMTRGTSFPQLAQAISDISRIVFDAVSGQ